MTGKKRVVLRKSQGLGFFLGHCGQQRSKPNSPSLGKGWPKAGVGAFAEAVRPLLSVTMNSDAYITTPPYVHPF